MKIDHVLYAVADLDAAATTFEQRYGLASYAGGHHPLFGTSNRIIPLGDAYIELIAVTDPDTASQNPLGVAIAARTASGDGWLAWVVAVEDLDAHASRVGATVVAGHRVRPDGVTVSWRAAGMERMLEDRAFPFFIAWDDPAVHPGRRSAAASSALTIEVAVDPDAIEAWLGARPSWLRLVPGTDGLRGAKVDGRVLRS